MVLARICIFFEFLARIALTPWDISCPVPLRLNEKR